MKSNFHTHSTFCDGKNSLNEIIKTAIEKKFDVLGFSSHCEYPFSDEWHIQIQKIEEYCKEIRTLQEEYADRIKLRLGFEADFIPGITKPTFKNYKDFDLDYLIGSVHYVYNEKGIFEADGSAESIKNAINNFYNGDTKSAIIRYFEQEREMIQNSQNEEIFTIIGHADLIRKGNLTSNLMNKGLDFFSENDSWYKEQIKLTADAIAKSGVIAEINTGAIARNNMKTPYPSDDFLKLLKERNVPITINSDCHDMTYLDCAYDLAILSAKKAGYTESVTDICKSSLTFSKFD